MLSTPLICAQLHSLEKYLGTNPGSMEFIKDSPDRVLSAPALLLPTPPSPGGFVPVELPREDEKTVVVVVLEGADVEREGAGEGEGEAAIDLAEVEGKVSDSEGL